MARISMKISKLADLDNAIPGLSKVWKQIKEQCRTSQARPKSLGITDTASKMCLDDGWIGKRFGLDLRTMTLADVALHVSSGEWACHAGPNNDQEIADVPNGFAIVDCEWHDYYRCFSMTLTVAKGAIPAQLAA